MLKLWRMCHVQVIIEAVVKTSPLELGCNLVHVYSCHVTDSFKNDEGHDHAWFKQPFLYLRRNLGKEEKVA